MSDKLKPNEWQELDEAVVKSAREKMRSAATSYYPDDKSHVNNLLSMAARGNSWRAGLDADGRKEHHVTICIGEAQLAVQVNPLDSCEVKRDGKVVGYIRKFYQEDLALMADIIITDAETRELMNKPPVASFGLKTITEP